MARIAVAVSGGADSLFALVSLKEQGHDVIAIHGLFLQDTQYTTISCLENICKSLNITLHVINLKKEFDQLIINEFIKSYAMGHTPNPCALCNTHIKFGLLMDHALKLNADTFATGHYATINKIPSLSPLAKGTDPNKEQSYFLSLVPRQRLEQSIFPLEKLKKTYIIDYLKTHGFNIPITKESQEICFVPNDAYRPFLEAEAIRRNIKLSKPGPIILKHNNTQKLLGQHKGLWQYTEGQRRGLNIAYSEPLYVQTKDHDNNTLILATANQLSLSGCTVKNINFLTPIKFWPKNTFARIRYRQQEAQTSYSWINDYLTLEFEHAQSPTLLLAPKSSPNPPQNALTPMLNSMVLFFYDYLRVNSCTNNLKDY